MNRAPEVADSSADADDEVSAIIASFGAALQDVTKPLAILAQFQVRDGTQALVEDAFAHASVSTANESGVIAYELHQDSNRERSSSVPTTRNTCPPGAWK